MLKKEIEDKLADRFVNNMMATNEYILEKIGNAIKEISELSPSNAYRLGQILKYRWQL